MGNSSQHFIGTETPGVPPNWNDAAGKFNSFRDAAGKILRQGARFRVYAYTVDASGGLSFPTEVTVGGDVVDIEWRVHLANRKASFFVFNGQDGATDNYVARATRPPTQALPGKDPPRTNLRNDSVPAGNRTALLEIDPGEKLISSKQPADVELANPNKNIPIDSLGTLRLDQNGRLIVLGGYGQSNSTEKPSPRQIDEYASNDTWFDDAGDGSVKARIQFKDGTFIDADAAWVMVGPPDFAPSIGPVVTLYDTLWDTAVRDVDAPASTPSTPALSNLLKQKKFWAASGGKSLAGFQPSFTNDIFPLLSRALGARDVHVPNAGKETYHLRTLGPDQIPLLADPKNKDGAGLRTFIFNYMRDPEGAQAQWDKMPRGLGDDYTTLSNDPANPSPSSFLSLTRIQFAMLRAWSTGDFINDWPKNPPVLSNNPAPSPDDLDRAAAENCVGGPFFPGIEVSWLIRVKNLYSEPFRLKITPEPETAQAPAPLQIGALVFRPGFFSQQMALPWQADFYDCQKEDWSDPDGKQYYFMWWTAQRPDDTFPSGSTEQSRWVRKFDADAPDPEDFEAIDNDVKRFDQMQSRWFELRFIAVKNGDHYEEEP